MLLVQKNRAYPAHILHSLIALLVDVACSLVHLLHAVGSVGSTVNNALHIAQHSNGEAEAAAHNAAQQLGGSSYCRGRRGQGAHVFHQCTVKRQFGWLLLAEVLCLYRRS
jgi:hypothetical protein